LRFVRVSALRFGQKGCGRTTVGQAQEQQAGAKVQLHWVRKVEHGVIPKGPREHRHDLARSESASSGARSGWPPSRRQAIEILLELGHIGAKRLRHLDDVGVPESSTAGDEEGRPGR
jgi:hypothetical protein